MKNKPIRIVIIGSGNVASRLGLAFLKSGCEIVQVFSRYSSDQSSRSGRALSIKLRAQLVHSYDGLITDATLYVIAVKDEAIVGVANALDRIAVSGLVVHTSGSISLNALGEDLRTGVLYPLQSLSKNRFTSFKTVPLCIEARLASDLRLLHRIGALVSNKLYTIGSEDRLFLHLGAVFAGNFTNLMYGIGVSLLRKRNLPGDILYPLIDEVAQKIVNGGDPARMQTGPAVRNDRSVLKLHLSLLEDEPDLQVIYKKLSKLIYKRTLSEV